MKIKISRRKGIDVLGSGSLSDLAFLLIVFFIVIAMFNINKGFILGLPQKNSAKILNVKDILRINLNEKGEVFLKENVVPIEEVEREIKDILTINPNLTVLLKIHPDVNYQKVVSVVEAVRKLNVENFSFSMLREGEKFR
ncbi:MAG TPA: biopolymer transporter ExbD [Spirochaetota bacterium]|nr:biopolymer transporter ExbD [Spirochaetota bacterium]HOS33400.1 biopolymer transporter ExbD [Spirochaetota bacterium]HOS56454.1 biopolymer transporter ExbD [Spirochaetota bacterium]HPK62351.1 biopolymer transporter ExbD [Spirochaetota bacterium]HQF78259.1 biopolymer transporter ExbD [Spirochaetota bacterium]